MPRYFLLISCFVLFLAYCQESFAARKSQPFDSQTVKFEFEDNWLVFQALVNGKSRRVILDSGASVFWMREGIYKDQKLRACRSQLISDFAKHSKKYKVCPGLMIGLFGRRYIMNATVLSSDDHWLKAKYNFDGLLGVEVFNDAVFEVDSRRKIVTVHETTQYSPKQADSSVSIKYRRQRPFVDIEINGREYTALLDTGFGGSIHLPRKFSDLSDGEFTPKLSKGVNRAGMVEDKKAAIKSISIAGLELKDVPAIIRNKRTAPSAADAVVGMGLLRNFIVTFDFPHRRLHLRPYPEGRAE